MKDILNYTLFSDQAGLWWLGQAGYILRTLEATVVIDPYLSDSAAVDAPEFSRQFPPPIQPEDLQVDIYIITHDHLDHLDPETLSGYSAKTETWFIGPRLVTKKLATLDIPEERIVRIDAGESQTVDGVNISGAFALPTGPDVVDTTGYLLEFANGRSVYHTSDTVFHPLVLAAAPHQPEVMLVPINGKWDNPGPEQAAEFAASVQPRFVIPNHYDLMALNAENPETFRWFCEQKKMKAQCVISERMQPFVWGKAS